MGDVLNPVSEIRVKVTDIQRRERGGDGERERERMEVMKREW